jgi:hypothetical protein
MHIFCTVREGGDSLGKPPLAVLKSKIDAAEAAGCPRLFPLPRDFPVAWAAYKAAPKVADNFRPVTIELTPQHYPFWSRTKEGEQGNPRGKLTRQGGSPPQDSHGLGCIPMMCTDSSVAVSQVTLTYLHARIGARV